MRLFAAVWPPDDVLDHLDLALATVRAERAGGSTGVRWSARETWHLTTAFYGDVPQGLVPAMVDELSAAVRELAPYRLALRGAGVFAHRTLWVGASGELDAHRRAVEACRAAGEAVGARDDGRARERPHLTVGRARPAATPRRPTRSSGRARAGRPGGDAPDGRPEAGLADDPAAALVRAFAVYEGPRWSVDELLLVESRPGEGRGGGPLYRPVDRVPLVG